MGVRSDVAFVICKEDYEALERAFEKHFPESKLLDCFDRSKQLRVREKPGLFMFAAK